MRAIRGLASLAVALAALVLPATALANQTLTVEKKGGAAAASTVTSSPAGINCGATCKASFADNTAVTLTGTAGAGSAPVLWSGCDSVTAENKCKVTMSAAKAITATFKLPRKLTVERKGAATGTVTSSPAGIDCGQTCSAEFENGAEVLLSGVPGPFSEAVKWSGCTSVDGENRCKVTMSSAKTVTATFNLAKGELKVTPKGTGKGTVTSSPAGINCGATCAASFDQGTVVTLTGTPSGEAGAAKWLGCDSVNAEGKCLVTITALREVSAIFNLPSYLLAVTKLGNGAGTVTSSPAGIECGSICAEGFLKGSSVTLKGAPGLHSEAVKWSGCDTVNLKGECVVAMSAAREVLASFSLEPQWVSYLITIRTLGTGKGTVTSLPAGIECPGDCAQEYFFETSLALLAKPAPGSEFDHWSVTACGASPSCTVSVKASRRINAVFTAVGMRTLSVAKAGTGQGTVTSNTAGIDCGQTCSAEFEASKKVALSAAAAPGSKFAGWSGEGCAGTKNCRVTMNEARNVTATFTANPGPTPPPAARCVVPRLAGKTLARARNALSAAHCALGKVRKPKGVALARLRVRSSSPAAGTTLAAGAKVNLRLARPRRH